MSLIVDIIARLDADKAASGLKIVGGAAQFQAAAETKPLATPAAYVMLLEESPGESEMASDLIQLVRVTVGVVLAERNVADAKGAAAAADMESLRNKVKAQLFGFSPSQSFAPLQRGPGKLLAFSDGLMWWQDTYFTSYYERSVL